MWNDSSLKPYLKMSEVLMIVASSKLTFVFLNVMAFISVMGWYAALLFRTKFCFKTSTCLVTVSLLENADLKFWEQNTRMAKPETGLSKFVHKFILSLSIRNTLIICLKTLLMINDIDQFSSSWRKTLNPNLTIRNLFGEIYFVNLNLVIWKYALVN